MPISQKKSLGKIDYIKKSSNKATSAAVDNIKISLMFVYIYDDRV